MSVLKALAGAAMAVGLVAFLASQSDPSGSKAASAEAARVAAIPFDPQKAFDDGIAAEAFWKRSKQPGGPIAPEPSYVAKVEAALTEIPLDWPRAKEAEAMVLRLRAERPAMERAYEVNRAKQVADNRASKEASLLTKRRSYAKIAETTFLDGGRDYYISTEGPDARTLRIKYVLMSRPMVHQIQNNRKVVDGWTDLGFKKVILTDGFRETWNLTLN